MSSQCPHDPDGHHEWMDTFEVGGIPQDICVLCGATREVDGNRTYSSNRTIWVDLNSQFPHGN